MKRTRVPVLFLLLSAFGLLLSCGSGPSTLGSKPSGPADRPPAPASVEGPFELTILHVNDTHSKLEPTTVKLTVDINSKLKAKGVYLELGGFPTLATALEMSRARSKAALFLHGGDMVQGTLYFTKYEGLADVDMLNALKLDAATLGNHEFDKGPELLYRNILSTAAFSVVDATVDISKEDKIADKSKLPPYVIKQLGGARIGLIGLTTAETPNISNPGRNLAFLDAAASVNKAALELSAKGINKIVLLSHQGYFEDVMLAPSLSKVDVIVGGHSHTLLGDFDAVGLKGAGPYPTVAADKDGRKVLVVQAWEWAKLLGNLTVSFDAGGEVVSWKADPRLLAGTKFIRVYDLPNKKNELKRVQFTPAVSDRPAISEYDGKSWVAVADDPKSNDDQYDSYKAVYDDLAAAASRLPVTLADPHPAVSEKLAGYGKGVSELRAQEVATAGEDLIRGLNSGSGQIVADGMRIKTGSRIALNNPGGVRTDLNQGPISVAAVYELLPFGNTLVTVELSGAELLKVIEDVVDFQISRYGADPKAAILYVSGVKFSLKLAAAKGGRIREASVLEADGSWKPLDLKAGYKCVVNNYMADGGDKNETLKASKGKYDTGFNDAEAFVEYIRGKTLTNVEARIRPVN